MLKARMTAEQIQLREGLEPTRRQRPSLTMLRSAGKPRLVERLSADEREEVRLGIEAVMRIKAALDRLGQRNAQLDKEPPAGSVGRAKDPSRPWSRAFVQRALRAALPGRDEALPLARHPLRLGDLRDVIFGGNLMPTSVELEAGRASG